MKSAYELSHVKSVSAYAVTMPSGDGVEIVGKIVANWSDNPDGSVCTCTVSVWSGPLAGLPKATDRAGGYGYCKLSAALCHAIRRGMDAAKSDPYVTDAQRAELAEINPPTFDGCGMSEHESAAGGWFASLGYGLIQIV